MSRRSLGGVLAVGVLGFVVIVAVGYLIGDQRASTKSDADQARQAAYERALASSAAETRLAARESGLAAGRRNGQRAGMRAGAADGGAAGESGANELLKAAAATETPAPPEDTNGPSDPCPPGTNLIPSVGCVNGSY